MKLKSKIFIVTDAVGEEINAEGLPIALDLNGERSGLKLIDIASHMEFDDGEIYCNSLLSHYSVNQDGSLEVEGSRVQLINEATGAPILVKAISRPRIHDNEDIPFGHVEKFANAFKIAKPEEVFPDLSDEEKQVFISAHVAAPAQVEEAPEPDTAANELAEQQKANSELKASIHPQYVQENSDYRATQGFYSGIAFPEYIKDKYHLFYGPDSRHEPCVLIKHGEWFEEIKEENTEIIDKTDKTVVLDFKGVNQKGRITLDLEAGDINISNLEPPAIP